MPEVVTETLPSRRGFLGVLGAVTAACAAGCGSTDDLADRLPPDTGDNPARLSFRPPPEPGRGGGPGSHRLEGIPEAPPAHLHAPAAVGDGLTLVVCLHGAGSPADRAIERLRPWADEHRLLLLAPKSVGSSWDVTRGGFGPDVANIDRLMNEVSARYPVRRYAVNGFSDGASYALCLGVANGRLFDSVVAWSPGFRVSTRAVGRPRFFVSHGTSDDVLPIGSTSRRIVPELRDDGYAVTYVEFDGGHLVPTDIRRRSVSWLVRGA